MNVGMRFILVSVTASLPLAAWLLADDVKPPPEAKAARKLVLVIHGGEGDLPDNVTPEVEKKFTAVLEEALRQGYAKLTQKKAGANLDAVEAAIRVMEDSPLFNAGKGAVFTRDGHNELDASIMEGKDKKAGAVAGVTIIKNPISAARALMDYEPSPHPVMLVGRAAELFAIQQKLEIVHPDYFRTEQRWKELQNARKKNAKREGPTGTVGAVALDGDGNLAAGTSTGGMTNKWSGRVGDSPIIGAGTYADNAACAISCTGWGEYFIRYAVAHDIAARVKYSHRSVKEAARAVINEQVQQAGGDGAAIVLGPDGVFHTTYNRLAGQMSRGYITSDDGQPHVAIRNHPLPGGE
jgi:beta-aspartyl-peptidase (threonine type)